MKKRYILLFLLSLSALHAFSQMYILNEDFSGASGTTPPVGWSIIVISGDVNDKWHFDNPGDRELNYPVTEPFAIFDADSISADGEPEEVSLETPLFDASTSNFILLHFVHVFVPGTSGTATIEVYDGDIWHDVITYTSATSNPTAEIVDLSAYTGGITNGRLRFTWSGNGSGFWAIDNIRLYASLPIDGGVVSIDSPDSPVVPGTQDVEITLGNFGYSTLVSAKIDWTADGVPQPVFNWNGNIGFGQTAGNIVIGSYNFQDPVVIKVWQSIPNGQADLNPYNDTISKFIVPPLCGNYTIGGTNPDFESISQAAEVLNIAGITCPVTFSVRNGTYFEQFELKDIQGVSDVNTVTFRSESGDSTLALIQIIPGALKYESMIYLNGSQHIHFQELGFATGSQVSFSNNAILMNGAENIMFEQCYFVIRNQFDFGISIKGGSREVDIKQCRFESISARAGAVTISDELTHNIDIQGNNIKGASDWLFSTILIGGQTGKINVTGNFLYGCYKAINVDDADSVLIHGNIIDNSNYGIFINQLCADIEISGNRLSNIKSHQNDLEGSSGIYAKNSTAADISNNFIHTTGNGLVHGISLIKMTASRVCYNSVNITNIDPLGRSRGLSLTDNSQVYARNNIFKVRDAGIPVYIDDYSPQLDLDKNNYYSFDRTIGYYDGIRYTDLQDWIESVGMDINSFSVIPFYTSETDLSISQALLNNTGIPVSGITDDIDGVLRNPITPDIGAKEYNPCADDAGINAVIGPANPLNGGLENITVLLQNQGSNSLTSALINWSVNGVSQTSFPWSGNLPEGSNAAITIGEYDFLPGILYTLKAWTTLPNNTNDCNNINDTISSQELAVPLCGNYTIGGSNPDFSTINEAVSLLNLSGVSCPVTLSIRNGTYYEEIVIREINGTSESNTVTFRSESGDSTQALIKLPPESLKFESIIILEGSQNVIFRELGIYTGSSTSFTNNAILLERCKNIMFDRCNFQVRREADLGLGIQSGCQGITVKHCRFESFDPKAISITANGDQTRDISILDNNIKGATEWGYATLRIGTDVQTVSISGNLFDNCYRAIYFISSDSALIRENIITNSNEGIYIDNVCSNIEISGNHLYNIKSHENSPEGTSGILINSASRIDIFNNFIHASGDGPVIGINLQNASFSKVNFNSINITNNDVQGKCKGIYLKTSSGIVARNNIFSITSTGTPVYISTNLTQIDFDRNDYYNADHTIGYFNGAVYSDLISWRLATNMDQNSHAVTPFFSAPTDPSINQALLNNAGSPVEGIVEDIDGTLRNPVAPDIGAKEYSPCENDAGINAIVSPESPLIGGTEEVRVILQNQGTSPLSSVKINWSVNAELQTPYSWSGNLSAASNAEVLLGSYNFQAGLSYVLKAWTSEPNSLTDCNHLNDTVSSGELAGPLCGTFTIGGTDPDFATVTQAANVLNSAGITCPVVFLIRDGLYAERLIIREIAGASSVNTITFRSESGDNTKAIIQIEAGAVNFEPMILLDNSDYIFFQDLGLFTGSTNGIANSAIQLAGASHIEINSCYFKTRNESDYGISIQGGSQEAKVSNNKFDCEDSGSGAIDISGAQTQNIDIQGNEITGAISWGNTLVKIGNNTRNINLTGNKLERSYRSVYAVGSDSLQIKDNIFRNTNSGIFIDNQCSDVSISANRLINVQSHANSPDGTSGIQVLNSSKIDIINNFIQTAGAGPVLGINLQNSNSCRTYYNSVNITNSDQQGKSKGFYLKTSDSILMKNNIFNIKLAGLPIHIDQNVTHLTLDYNDYYNSTGIVGKIIDQVYTNIFVWGQTVNGDANSQVVNPYFKADTIPLPLQRMINGSGIALNGVMFDIDGKQRNIQAPDMGCMEFFVDFGVLDLLSPSLNCFHPDVDSVKVYIRQFGDVPFDNMKVAYQLDNGTIHIDTIPGPIQYDFIHTFETTETISAPGEYTFRVWIIYSPVDDNFHNDTLIAKRYSKPPPVVSIAYDNLCTGWEVHFTGNATIAEPYYVAQYEWIFGDGDTSYLQDPVHTYQAAGTYEVILRAYSDAGCYSEEYVPVTIDPDFQGLMLDYILVNETCLGDSTGSLEFIATGGNPPYTYFVNGVQMSGSVIPHFSPGIYQIKVVDSQNCTSTDTLEANTLVTLDPQILADPLTGFIPLTVDFDFTANDAESWKWYFSDTETDTIKTPSYTFIDYGYHLVTLEVQSGPPYYCTETASIEIFVDIVITIDANSVFTPNDDGFNDFFEVKSFGLKEMSVKIFNQWGNMIYEIGEVDGKWDGNTKGGAQAPDGTYYYSLTATGINDLIYTRQGSVLLLRHGSAAFPNPVIDRVQMETNETLQAPVTVSVYSLFGQLTYKEIINDPENIIINISHLSSGIYIMKADDGKNSCFVRIIKN